MARGATTSSVARLGSVAATYALEPWRPESIAIRSRFLDRTTALRPPRGVDA